MSQGYTVPTVSGTATIPLGQPGGPNFSIPLSGATTVTATGIPTEPGLMRIIFVQDSTGETVSFDPTVFVNPPSIPPTPLATIVAFFAFDPTSNLFYTLFESNISEVNRLTTSQTLIDASCSAVVAYDYEDAVGIATELAVNSVLEIL